MKGNVMINENNLTGPQAAILFGAASFVSATLVGLIGRRLNGPFRKKYYPGTNPLTPTQRNDFLK